MLAILILGTKMLRKIKL